MKQQNFESLMLSFGYRHDLHTIFNNFLTKVIASFSRNRETGLSYLEDEYLETINKYDKGLETKLFPEMLAQLVDEMTNGKVGNNDTKDILGDFFQSHISNGRKGQYFTPEPICTMMAQITHGEKNNGSIVPQSILDPCCGSGRMLIA